MGIFSYVLMEIRLGNPNWNLKELFRSARKRIKEKQNNKQFLFDSKEVIKGQKKLVFDTKNWIKNFIVTQGKPTKTRYLSKSFFQHINFFNSYKFQLILKSPL